MQTARRNPLPFALLALLALVIGGCGASLPPPSRGGKLKVVAAEDFWGSIAQQLGGGQVEVTSIITNPAADPHEYEPTSADARTIAGSQMAIVNGIGYDPWATRLLAADASSQQTVLSVGELLGLKAGANPHQWYSPSAVQRVIDRISADYKRADPRESTFFDSRRAAFEASGLVRYRSLIAQIKDRFAGTPVGASESIFEPLAPALGLKLITPPGFMNAIAEGTEPTSADKVSAERQIATHQIKVWVYNSQNATPDVQRLNEAAKAAGIPIATLTETLTPEHASFQAWMTHQLEGLLATLTRAAKR
jgi:zinc/manganese transport system substrate-binding protein